MIALHPLPGHALIEIREKYEHVATTEQKYETRTSGICIEIVAVSGYPFAEMMESDQVKAYMPIRGKIVYWQEYKDGAILERDGKKYTFVKIEDLDGYEDEQIT